MKKTVFLVVALFVFSSVAAIGLEASVTNKELAENEYSAINIVRRDASNAPVFAVESTKTSLKREAIPTTDTPIANLPEDEIHPNIANGGGVFFAGYAYSPSIVQRNVYTLLSMDGETWEPFVHIEGDDISHYPAFGHWAGGRFCGTFVGTEASQYLLDAEDVTDPEAAIDLIYWDWSDNGWSDFREFDIACDNSQNTWEYGVMSTVATTDYTGWEVTDGPHMFFRSPDEEGTGYISWDIYPGCAHSAASIDRTDHMIYNVYDYYNEDTARWNILVWKRDFSDPLEGDSEIIEIESEYYAQYPTVAASNGNVIVIAESEEHIALDLVCYYSSDAGATWQTSYVTNTPENEKAADLLMTGSDTASVVFVKDNDLYISTTEDGGATWSAPIKVNEDSSGTVVDEFRTADTCNGAVVWTDTRDGNKDIYFATLGNAPNKPSITGPSSGRTRRQLTYTATTTDPNGDQVYYWFDWGDGSNSGWVGPYNSGADASESNSWSADGTYEVKVKSKDTSDNESPWSDPIPVSIPRNRVIFGNLIQRILERFNIIFSL